MQVSVLDLSLKCKTIASLVQVNVGMLKNVGSAHAELEGVWGPCFPPLTSLEALRGLPRAL